MKSLVWIFASMRPAQWTKNFVVFAALIFSRNLLHGDLALRSVEGFVVFCLLSGAVYLINDIADVDRDRLHTEKRNRPLPSGRLSVRVAVAGALVMLLIAGAGAWRLGPGLFAVACGFISLNILYSFVLKRVALLDVMSISVSFILRAIAGVEVLRPLDATIEISPWLLICTLFLSLFLAFCKRRHELLSFDGAADHREVLTDYSPALIDSLVSLTAGGAVLSYSIYTIWPDTVEKFGTQHLVYTIPLVLLGVMRYLYLVYKKDKGGSPSDLLLGEPFLLIDVIAWIALVIVILQEF